VQQDASGSSSEGEETPPPANLRGRDGLGVSYPDAGALLFAFLEQGGDFPSLLGIDGVLFVLEQLEAIHGQLELNLELVRVEQHPDKGHHE